MLMYRKVKFHQVLFLLIAVSGFHSAYGDEKDKYPNPTLKEISYGPHDRNKLDFWKCDSKAPTPVVVSIHGGGWSSGEKGSRLSHFGSPKVFLDQQISVVAINYRLARPPSVLPCSVHDAARAIQFIRHNAAKWNVNPKKIIVTGASAGGCSSLWLAYHADLADPKSEDPVARQSTRVLAAVAKAAQTTLDPFFIEKSLGPVSHPMIWRTVGAESIADLKSNWKKYEKLSNECSPIFHVTKDDPPVYLVYTHDEPTPIENNIHHAGFGRLLKKKCEELELECNLHLSIKDKPKPTFSAMDFILRVSKSNPLPPDP